MLLSRSLWADTLENLSLWYYYLEVYACMYISLIKCYQVSESASSWLRIQKDFCPDAIVIEIYGLIHEPIKFSAI